MDLNKLSAQELARLDAICLEFESDLRRGKQVSIKEIVRQHGGKNAKILLAELKAIEREVGQESKIPVPFSANDVKDSPAANKDQRSLSNPIADSNEQPLTIDSIRHNGFDTDVSAASARATRVDMETFPAPGTRLGPYLISQEIGKGGMGVVYRARDTRLKREVAIKVLSVTGRKRQELTERFEREARAVAALSHPNIVELFDVGVTGPIPYAVMEYLKGPTLAEYLESNDLSTAEIREIGSQIASALATAHRSGVIHRDLKPQNVILVEKDASHVRVKLLDFGLSRELRDQSELTSSDIGKTREGTILGTPGYMSPEQARGEPATAAADIFGLGCILFEAMYSKAAIEGPTVAERFAATLTHTPEPDPVRRRDDLPLADLIQQCVAGKPEDRPDASTVHSILRQWPEPESDQAIETGSGRRQFLAAFAGGVIGSLGIGYWLTSGGDDLESIDSLAVLSFDDLTSPTDSNNGPIGDREMSRGEEIAATLVNELSRLDQLKVLPFVPLHAKSQTELKETARRLGVDALITGALRRLDGELSEQIELTLQIISAEGVQLWSETVTRPASDRMLQHSTLATEIATRIGRKLVATAESPSPPSPKRYNCFVDGQARANIDSVAGLKMALKCFELAHRAAPTDVSPLAEIAITALNLAAQSTPTEADAYMATALEKLSSALDIDRGDVDVRLAEAMIEWQKLRHYEKAGEILQGLVEKHPYVWKIRHQHGLLQTVMQRNTEAREHLNTAVLLNPLSAVLKTDLARLEWFVGHDMTAESIAKRAKDELAGSELPKGLLVDIYEQQGSFDLASAELGWETSPGSAAAYFERRAETLDAVPYGPFGSVLNTLILRLRQGDSIDETRLAQLGESPLPMFPLLLSRHPAFSQTRSSPDADRYLPSQA